MIRLTETLRTISRLDGGVILDLRGGRIFHLNASAAAILDLLVHHHDCTEEHCASELIRRFGIDRSSALADVQAFLESLSNNGLIRDGAD